MKLEIRNLKLDLLPGFNIIFRKPDCVRYMYMRRVKESSGVRLFYLITNRVTGGSVIFGDVEKEYLRKLMFSGQQKMGYEGMGFLYNGQSLSCANRNSRQLNSITRGSALPVAEPKSDESVVRPRG